MAHESTAITDLVHRMSARPVDPRAVVRDSEPTFFYHRQPQAEPMPTLVIPRADQPVELSPTLVMSVAVVIGIFAGILVAFA